MSRQWLLYCAGPITGLSYAGVTDWREYVKKRLPPTICALSPMRAKNYLADESRIQSSYEHHPLSSSRGLTTRDYFDVMRCDAVLANLLGATERVSIGTVFEIAWAFPLRKPVILVIEPEGNIHDYPMIKEASGFRVSTLDDAIDIARCVLSPDP